MTHASASTGIERLATYGTLAPGQPNAHHLASLTGEWTTGVARGHLVDAGWGADAGYPGMILDRTGPTIPVSVFTSAELTDHWQRLDHFEGPEYRRVAAPIEMTAGIVTAFVYVLNTTP